MVHVEHELRNSGTLREAIDVRILELERGLFPLPRLAGPDISSKVNQLSKKVRRRVRSRVELTKRINGALSDLDALNSRDLAGDAKVDAQMQLYSISEASPCLGSVLRGVRTDLEYYSTISSKDERTDAEAFRELAQTVVGSYGTRCDRAKYGAAPVSMPSVGNKAMGMERLLSGAEYDTIVKDVARLLKPPDKIKEAPPPILGRGARAG